jgi:putative transposase
MCNALQVSKSGYYDWHERAPSARAIANVKLLDQIKAAHTMSDVTYGMPRIRAELADSGVIASRKRIAALMRVNGIAGVSRRRGYCVTTVRNPTDRPAPDLVKRQFIATDINQLWVADMTYIPTWQGFLYLAVVTDVFSRKVVGWAFGARQTADLVVAALNMALFTRKPESVIHHSDQGSQYTSVIFGKRCAEMKVRPSMGSVGDAYDNAMAESFFATLECELIDRRVWKTHTEARHAIFTWIESWYNPHRRHSGLGQMSPMNFERKHALQQQNKDIPAAALATEQEHGLPTGCCAPVDKSSLATLREPPTCPQAGPVDKPAPEHATASNYRESTNAICWKITLRSRTSNCPWKRGKSNSTSLDWMMGWIHRHVSDASVAFCRVCCGASHKLR